MQNWIFIDVKREQISCCNAIKYVKYAYVTCDISSASRFLLYRLVSVMNKHKRLQRNEMYAFVHIKKCMLCLCVNKKKISLHLHLFALSLPVDACI